MAEMKAAPCRTAIRKAMVRLHAQAGLASSPHVVICAGAKALAGDVVSDFEGFAGGHAECGVCFVMANQELQAADSLPLTASPLLHILPRRVMISS